jgi:hypothetical protein
MLTRKRDNAVAHDDLRGNSDNQQSNPESARIGAPTTDAVSNSSRTILCACDGRRSWRFGGNRDECDECPYGEQREVQRLRASVYRHQLSFFLGVLKHQEGSLGKRGRWMDGSKWTSLQFEWNLREVERVQVQCRECQPDYNFIWSLRQSGYVLFLRSSASLDRKGVLVSFHFQLTETECIV